MKKNLTTLPLAAAALLLAAPSPAQDIKVNVTGTNIKRVDTETAAPIETITREDIQASGLQTIAAVVQSITANNNGTISNAFVNGFGAGASGVSLRGLGANNTLVLINGRRLAVYGLADDGQRSFVNLNQVPFDAVERIEILKDGASAIYGSDAVAGVVNIILRQQYTGITATATGGATYKGDGEQFRGAFTAGIGDLTKDRYNAFITVDGQSQRAIPTSNRRQYVGTNNLEFMGLPDARPGNPFSGFGTSSLVGNVRPVSAENPNGTPSAFQTLPGCAAASVDADGFCRWEVKDYLQIQPKTENVNVLAKGTYQINDTTQAYAEFGYFQSKVSTQFTPQAVRSTWYNTAGSTVISSANIYLPVGHPDNPFSATNQVARLYYAAADVGGRNSDYQDDTQRYLLGIKGTNYGWDWDLGALYIANDGSVTQRGLLNYQNLLQALNGNGGFGYYRVGASAGLNNPGIYGFISPELTFDTRSENTQVDFKATRDLMKLDGGALALALGAEYRREELKNPGETEVYLGNIIGLGYSSAEASRNVTAVYGELYAPLLKNLELTAALRYDNYSDYGSNWAPKVGVKYNPIQQLALRGTYSTGFRAPGPYESGNSATNGFTSVVDPVRCPVTGSPGRLRFGQRRRDRDRQSEPRARGIDELDGRPGLGADAGLERHRRLLEHRDEAGDQRRRRAARRERSCGVSERADPARHLDRPSGHPELRDAAGRGDAVPQRLQAEHRRRRRVGALPDGPQGLRHAHDVARLDARVPLHARVQRRLDVPVRGHARPDGAVELGGRSAGPLQRDARAGRRGRGT